TLLRPPPGPLLRCRPDYPRPGRKLRGAEGDERCGGRALAGAEPGLRGDLDRGERLDEGIALGHIPHELVVARDEVAALSLSQGNVEGIVEAQAETEGD